MNKHLSPEKSQLFRNKLKKILENISREREVGSLQTQEAYVLEAVRLLSTFYSTITSTNYSPKKVFSGTFPNLKDYNQNFNEIKDDLLILFQELENLEGVVLEHFNLVAAHSNRLNSRVKRLSGKVTDFSLYSKLPIKNSLFFSDTFSDLSKTEVNSDLLNATQAEINQVEGIVTLPVIPADSVTLEVTNRPLINSNSNGRVGNNEEIGARLNSNTQALLDNNPDTWFEYERVLRVDDNTPLVLDLTINLGTEEIINFIRISPNNFGTKTEIEIVDISTSTDGQLFTSVKDDIPIEGFLTEDEENVFKLAPASSKYAGEGLFTFTPRFTKYIRLILKQSTPYFIQTVQGQQFRYAIGIRDIEIKRLAYEAVGEIVSAPYSLDHEIKKISLQSNQVPLQNSSLARIRHFVSVDNGNSWNPIAPLEDEGTTNLFDTIPEILDINTEAENAIKTESPVYSIRYKSLLERLDDGFTDGSTAFVQDTLLAQELKPVPLSDPWTLVLTHSPIVNSIGLIDPSFGSRGNSDSKYLIGIAGSRLEYRLPWIELPVDVTKVKSGGFYSLRNKDILSVFVDGQEWRRVPTLLASGPEDRDYEWSPPFLRFGNGDPNGRRPTEGSIIEVLFTPERLFPVNENDHRAFLNFNTSIDKSTVSIFRQGRVTSSSATLAKQSNIHRLPNRNLRQGTLSFSGTNIFTDEKVFKNGQIAEVGGELENNGDFSVDYERGIIYSFGQTGEDGGTVSYQYQEVVELTSDQWDWGDDLSMHRSVEIKEDAWVTEQASAIALPETTTVFTLPHLSLVKGSVEFIIPDGVPEEDNPLLEEVEYSGVSGNPELSSVILTREQIPVLAPIGDIAEFSVSTFMSPSSNLAVSFSNSEVFQQEVLVANPPVSGQYYLDRNLNKVIVNTGGLTVQDPGEVSYYANDPSRVARGAYSIDYKLGIVYLQRPIPSSGFGISYEYSDYRIQYNIAREIPEREGNTVNWVLDAPTKTITLQTPEVLKRANIPQVSTSTPGTIRPLVYLVNYKYVGTSRKDIARLLNHFTPVLKDYALRVVTKENL